MVLTHTGERKRLDEIRVGDRVIAHTGTPRIVQAVHVQGELPCVRIRTELGRETVAALNHPFLTPAGWVEAGNLRPGDVLAIVPRPATSPSEDARTFEEFRLAGYFVGDGCTTFSKGSCNSTVTAADPGVAADLFTVADACGFTVKPWKVQAKRAPQYHFGNGVHEWLRSSGLAGRSSHAKRVPPWVFRGSEEQIANFLGAYYDCDGTLSGRGLGRNGGARKDPCVEFNSVNRPLLSDAQHLLLRLGIRARLSQKNGKYCGRPHVSWRLTITSVDDVAKFSARIPLHGERGERLKRLPVPRTRFDPQFIEDPVVSVEDAGTMPCRCLTVEEDHTFTSDDLVVHNTWGVTIPYPAWRMLTRPGTRAGVGSHTQRYANKISRWVRKVALSAGGEPGDVNREDEWSLSNGSTFVAKGVGAALAGEPFDLFVMDDVFGAREDADSLTTQEKIHEWYMDDVVSRLQKDAAVVLCNTRWGSGDLFGRIKDSEEGREWVFWRVPAVSETQEERDRLNETYGLPAGLPDPVGRESPGLPLCEDRFPLAQLEQKRRASGVGFDCLFQGNPIPRGGTFFQRDWFGRPVDAAPEGCEYVRYWDLAASRADSACFTSGVLMAKHGAGETQRFFVADVIRGRWMPAERNEVMLQTAQADKTRPGFRRTWFEEPVFDKDRAAARAIIAKLAGHPVTPDKVSGSGSKEIRAEPLAGAAKAGLVRLVAGSWNGAFLTELEGFPRGQYKDQVDSSSGAYNKLSLGEARLDIYYSGGKK